MEDQKFLTTSAGVKMPWLIYGTAWKKERTADLVVKAIQAGFRGIDTACQPKHYDEPLVGSGLQRLKDSGVEREALFPKGDYVSPRLGSLLQEQYLQPLFCQQGPRSQSPHSRSNDDDIIPHR